MNIDTAKVIQASTQSGIRELNRMLLDVQQALAKEEFVQLRGLVAQAMGRLIDIENDLIYPHYPELRPYDIKPKT